MQKDKKHKKLQYSKITSTYYVVENVDLRE